MGMAPSVNKDLLAPMATVDQAIPGCHCLVCASSEDLLLCRGISGVGGVRLAAVCAACGARTPVEHITGPNVTRLIMDDEYAADAISRLWVYWKATSALCCADYVAPTDVGDEFAPELITDTAEAVRKNVLKTAATLSKPSELTPELTFHDALNLYLARLITGKTYTELESCPDLCGDASVAISYLNERCSAGSPSSGQAWSTTRTPPNGFGCREEYVVKIGDVSGRAPTFELAAALALMNTVWHWPHVAETQLLVPWELSDSESSDSESSDSESSDKG